jgi:hypothetical protein
MMLHIELTFTENIVARETAVYVWEGGSSNVQIVAER